jgi:UDP-N-acetylglucosamine pyrophosphorylase
LEYNGPKGTFRCSPVTRKSLFALQAERIRAADEAFGVPYDALTQELEKRNIGITSEIAACE